MRLPLLAPAALLVLPGCLGTPRATLAPTAAPRDLVYACATREISERGYNVLNASADAGFIRAERQTRSLLGHPVVDLLYVTVYPSAHGSTVLRVLPERVLEVDGERQKYGQPKRVREDAREVVRECTPGPRDVGE